MRTRPIPDETYRRGYRLWNKLNGRRLEIRDSRHPEHKKTNQPLPDGPHCDLKMAGVVILEGWISS